MTPSTTSTTTNLTWAGLGLNQAPGGRPVTISLSHGMSTSALLNQPIRNHNHCCEALPFESLEATLISLQEWRYRGTEKETAPPQKKI